MWRLPLSLNSVLGYLCRLSGLATALILVHVCLSRGLSASTPMAIVQLVATGLLAILIGGIVRECTFAIVEALVTASGHPFLRESRTVTGKRISEVWLPDGKWVRCKTSRSGTALAWSERDGSCTEIEMPAMTTAHAEPPRPRTVSYSREQLQGRMRAASFSAGRLQAEAWGRLPSSREASFDRHHVF